MVHTKSQISDPWSQQKLCVALLLIQRSIYLREYILVRMQQQEPAINGKQHEEIRGKLF
jgi:hypothetical protein